MLPLWKSEKIYYDFLEGIWENWKILTSLFILENFPLWKFVYNVFDLLGGWKFSFISCFSGVFGKWKDVEFKIKKIISTDLTFHFWEIGRFSQIVWDEKLKVSNFEFVFIKNFKILN